MKSNKEEDEKKEEEENELYIKKEVYRKSKRNNTLNLKIKNLICVIQVHLNTPFRCFQNQKTVKFESIQYRIKKHWI